MKKTLFTICLISTSLFSFAQLPTLGIKSGVNFASITNSIDGSSVTSSALTTFNAGIFVDIKFGNTSLQPALNFTGKGGSGNNDFNGNTKLYYLQLPVNIVYHVPAVIGNFYFGAGPYIARGLSGKETDLRVVNPAPITEHPGGPSIINEDIKFGSGTDEVKSTQIGADAIVGFQFKGGFLINANYDLGLTNDSNNPSEKSKSHVFGISVGYTFL